MRAGAEVREFSLRIERNQRIFRQVVDDILLKPQYTSEDREKAFSRLDSLRTKILDDEIKFNLAARFFSEDPAT
ncbi:MAG: hypothetical protein IIZ87_06240, partial [Selenomonas sp.]|nr:hypothetical protein [Selenomonas sp.]